MEPGFKLTDDELKSVVMEIALADVIDAHLGDSQLEVTALASHYFEVLDKLIADFSEKNERRKEPHKPWARGPLA